MATIIRHPKGNTLKVRIPLSEKTTTLERGKAVSSVQDFLPNQAYPVKVLFIKGSTKYVFEATMIDNVAQIIDYGTIDNGVYAVEVLCRDDQGKNMRFKQQAVLEIVDRTEDAGIQSDGDEMTVVSRYPVAVGEAGYVDEDGFITFQVGRHFKGDEDYTDEYAEASAGFGTGTVTIDDNFITLNI